MIVAAALLAAPSLLHAQQAQANSPTGPDVYGQLKYRYIGPEGNRATSGTGESFIRSHISVGQGIYKSIDAGKTWTLMGLEKAGRIGRVEIDPRNPDVVLACALGHAYGPQPERGVFRSTDGGKTWTQVLFVDENTGCSDMG